MPQSLWPHRHCQAPRVHAIHGLKQSTRHHQPNSIPLVQQVPTLAASIRRLRRSMPGTGSQRAVTAHSWNPPGSNLRHHPRHSQRSRKLTRPPYPYRVSPESRRVVEGQVSQRRHRLRQRPLQPQQSPRARRKTRQALQHPAERRPPRPQYQEAPVQPGLSNRVIPSYSRAPTGPQQRRSPRLPHLHVALPRCPRRLRVPTHRWA